MQPEVINFQKEFEASGLPHAILEFQLAERDYLGAMSIRVQHPTAANRSTVDSLETALADKVLGVLGSITSEDPRYTDPSSTAEAAAHFIAEASRNRLQSYRQFAPQADLPDTHQKPESMIDRFITVVKNEADSAVQAGVMRVHYTNEVRIDRAFLEKALQAQRRNTPLRKAARLCIDGVRTSKQTVTRVYWLRYGGLGLG